MNRNVCGLGLAVATLATGFAGCSGPKLVDVSGRVTYNGTPLDRLGGKIVFVGLGGSQVAADIGRDGTYKAAGVPAGSNQIAVYYPNPDAKLKTEKKRPVPPQPGEEPAPSPAPPSVPEPFVTPPRYASVETSELLVEVGPGTVFDATLTGPPIP